MFCQIRLLFYSLALLYYFTAAAEEGQEVIVLVKNSNVNRSSLAEDIEGQIKISADFVAAMKKLNVKIDVEIVETAELFRLEQSVMKKVGTRALRGLVFLGHGNSNVYALNSDEVYGAKAVAKSVGSIIENLNVGEAFTVYFYGCEIGNGHRQTGKFQQIFYQELARTTEALKKPLDLEVIAHEYSVAVDNGVGFCRPTSLNILGMRSGLGPFFERYSMLLANWAGGYSPLFMNMFSILAPSLTAILTFPEYRELAATFGLVVIGLTRFLSPTAFKIGSTISRNGKTKGFVHDFLRTRFSCDSMLK